jgi:hypothetical protein
LSGGIDLAKQDAVEDQVLAVAGKIDAKIAVKIKGSVSSLGTEISSASVGSGGGTAATKLAFRIHEVKCFDETGPTDLFGMDEIDLGATSIATASDSVTESGTVQPFRVKKFDSGDVKTYSPPKVLTTFDVTKGAKFPKTYAETIALAEKDSGGGFPDFVNEIEKELVAKVSALIGAWVGSGAGPVGTLIGLAVGYVIGRIFDWLESFLNDDIFNPVTVFLTRTRNTEPLPGGAATSAKATATFKGHGGKYGITYDWQLA